VLENKEYSLADTYPRYLVLPALMTKDEIRIAAGAYDLPLGQDDRVHHVWTEIHMLLFPCAAT
jgi:hypothetical protein